MTRVVYTNEPHIPLSRLISPPRIVRDLLRYRELIGAYARRDFQATHRGTYLGLAWTVFSPLIMLALFVGVFGYIFGGRFNPRVSETPAEFALALFIGLSFYNCLGQTLSSSPNLVTANQAYVKTLAFPLEILSVSSVLNILMNLAIALAICFVAHFVMYGHLNLTSIALVAYVVCIALLSLGVSWFLSALAVFVRDVPAVIAPINIVLMFISGVFFPLSVISPRIRWLIELNPLAIIIDQARSVLMYGQWPDFRSLAAVFLVSLATAVGGYVFFMKAKSAFADVM